MRLLGSGKRALGFALTFSVVSPAAAQQLTISPGDEAIYKEFVTVCAQPLADMKKTLGAAGEPVTDAQIRDQFVTTPAFIRDKAREENVTVPVALGMMRAQVQKDLADPDDPSTKILAPTIFCWLDMMTAREKGGAAPSHAPSPSMDVKDIVRAVCAEDFTAYVRLAENEGTPGATSGASVEEIVRTFVLKGPQRDGLIDGAAYRMAPTRTSSDFTKIGASACVARTSVAVEMGTTDTDRLRELWKSYRTGLLKEIATIRAATRSTPPPATSPTVTPAAPQTAAAVDCVILDSGAGKRGEAALLRNRCTHAVYVGVCLSNVTAGSATEALACERNQFEVWKIESRTAAMIDTTDGERYFWRACQAPFKPRLWWDATLAGDARSRGACENR